VKAGIDLIAELGGNQVLFNGGKRAFGVPHAETWTRAAGFLAQAADHAQKTSVYITLEAEPYVYFLVNDIGSTLEMLREVDHPHLLAAVDIGHMNLSREGPEALQEIEPWIGRVHLSENDGLLHANNILGTGSVDFRLYLEAMQTSDLVAKQAARGVELTTVMELGVLGDEILDPDGYTRRSMQYVLSIAPFMTI
jgi:sugar phosphate isomerase/epimerase